MSPTHSEWVGNYAAALIRLTDAMHSPSASANKRLTRKNAGHATTHHKKNIIHP
jgi:hypothetical protein